MEYRRFEGRRGVVCSLSAYKEPKLGQERRLQVEHFTPSIPDAKYRLRKHGCVQKQKFRYFGFKSHGTFQLSLSLLLSFFFILVQFFGPGNLVSLISVGNVLENSRLMGIRRKTKCRWVVEDFHHHFRLNVSVFVVLSGLLDLIVLAFWHGLKDLLLPQELDDKFVFER